MAPQAQKKQAVVKTRKQNVDMDFFVGQRLRAIRQLKGLTQREVIRLAGLRTTQQIYSKYEAGTVRLSASILYALANALHVNVEAFFPVANLDKKIVQDNGSVLLEKSLKNSLAKLKKIEKECATEIEALSIILRDIKR